MRIGIDESGLFDVHEDKMNIFLAAHILDSNNKLEIKKHQFNEWKNNLSYEKFNSKGEIKGQLLNESNLLNFMDEVIHTEPKVKTTIVGVNPSEIGISLIEKIKKIEVEKNELAAAFYKAKYPKRIANRQIEKAKWLKKRNLIQFLKIYGLKFLLVNSIRETWMYSLYNNCEEELLDINYMVDEDFLKEENIHWKSYKEDAIEQYSEIYKIPIPTDLTNDVLKTKINYSNRGKYFYKIFNDNFDFYKSSEFIEIQIADILAIIPYRSENKSISIELGNTFVDSYVIKDSYKSIGLLDFDYDKAISNFKKRISEIR